MKKTDIENAIAPLKGQQIFGWMKRHFNGWLPALVSTGPHGVRIQLQAGNENDPEDTGDIKCIVGRDLVDAIDRAIEYTSKNDPTSRRPE